MTDKRLTPEEEAEVRAAHRPSRNEPDAPDGWCDADDFRWPCDTALVLATLDAARVAAPSDGLRKTLTSYCDAWVTAVPVDLIRAALAATKQPEGPGVAAPSDGHGQCASAPWTCPDPPAHYVAAPSDGLRARIEALPWNPWRDEDEPLGPDERSWGAGVEWYVGEYRAAVLAELDRAAPSDGLRLDDPAVQQVLRDAAALGVIGARELLRFAAPSDGALSDYQRGYVDGFDAPANVAARARVAVPSDGLREERLQEAWRRAERKVNVDGHRLTPHDVAAEYAALAATEQPETDG